MHFDCVGAFAVHLVYSLLLYTFVTLGNRQRSLKFSCCSMLNIDNDDEVLHNEHCAFSF